MAGAILPRCVHITNSHVTIALPTDTMHFPKVVLRQHRYTPRIRHRETSVLRKTIQPLQHTMRILDVCTNSTSGYPELLESICNYNHNCEHYNMSLALARITTKTCRCTHELLKSGPSGVCKAGFSQLYKHLQLEQVVINRTLSLTYGCANI